MSDTPPLQPLQSFPPPPLPPLEAGVFSFENAFSVGFALFQRRYGLLLGVSAFVFGMSIVDAIVANVLDLIAQTSGVKAFLAIRILWSIGWGIGVTLPLNAALLIPAVKALRTGRGEFMDIFLGYKRFIHVFLYALLMGAVILIALLPAIVIIIALAASKAAPEAMLLAGAACVLLYVPFIIYFATRLLFVNTILLDAAWGKPDVMQAIKGSWAITRNNFWTLFALSLVCGVLVIASMLLLCVGLFLVGYPLYTAILGAAYVQLARPAVGDNAGGTVTPDTEACQRCGYKLAPTFTVCPECGTPRNWYGPRGI